LEIHWYVNIELEEIMSRNHRILIWISGYIPSSRDILKNHQEKTGWEVRCRQHPVIYGTTTI